MKLASMCFRCKHLILQDDQPELRCNAFSGAIPIEISNGAYDHRLAHEGDGGVRFDALNEHEEEMVKRL